MVQHRQLSSLREAAPAVLPSMLMCDFGALAAEVAALEAAGAPGLHLDVMDGHFVPNLSYGLPLVETFRRLTDLPLDVHLMISNPGEYLQRFAAAGADVLTIHAEAVDDPRPLLAEIRNLGCAAGLAINPPTSVESIADCLDACDMVLVMSVMPGFGGQKFDPRALEKLQTVRKLGGADLVLEIDGGVNQQTIGDCVRAGAELLVVGSAILGGDDYSARIAELRDRAVPVG
jgi:ribulose-phosphate 3-epimerase